MLHLNTKCVEQYNQDGTTPSFLTDHTGTRAFKLKYVPLDGWRGFYEAVAVKKYGWEKIDYEGWVTGNWSDAPEGHSEDEVSQQLQAIAKEYEAKGYDVEAVFMLTSNVFSTAFDVFVKKVK